MSLSVLSHRRDLRLRTGRPFIDGRWAEGHGVPWTHTHPASNEQVGVLTTATKAQVDSAVRAARRAFEGDWPDWKARDRKRLLQRIAQLVDEQGQDLDLLQTLDNGLPISFSSVYEASHQIAADIFDYHAGWVDRVAGQTLPAYTG